MSSPPNSPPNCAPEQALTAPDAPAAIVGTTRPFLWSVRRELWENRSVALAPPAVAALVLLASSIAVAALPRRIASLPGGDPAALQTLVTTPFGLAPAPIMLACFLVGAFYALDALYGERRDRSLLFWKSLPVSDLTSVLAKAAVPLVVLPLIAFLLSVVTFGLLLLVGSVAFLVQGASPATLWTEVRFLQEPVVMLYGLTVHSLWFAPLYGWLLLVSAWARRTPLLWAALPPIAIGAVERLAFGTSLLGDLLRHRVTGAMAVAFTAHSRETQLDPLAWLDPVGFLAAPGLWLGLVAAAAFLAAAVRLRRRREPL